jgi:hypothetical protein
MPGTDGRGSARAASEAGDAEADDEREAEAARSLARMQRLTELPRKHTKAELLRVAYPGGMVRHSSPEQ